MKRTYLTNPGQSIKISVAGPSGCGKTALIQRMQDVLASDGVLVSGSSGGFEKGLYVESFNIECPTEKQARDKYFEKLSVHEIATLKGHLAALGYEFE